MKNKKWIIIISSIIVISFISIGIVIGRIVHMHNEFNNEMVRIANSKAAHKIYKRNLKTMDKFAFTKEGKIHSYKVDQKSIEHNQMGGINVTLIINNNLSLTTELTIDSDNNGKNLDDEVETDSPKLDELVNGDKNHV